MINIIYPQDGWILEKLARKLLDKLPNTIGLPHHTKGLYDLEGPLDQPGGSLNYYINYPLFKRKTRNIDVGFFTHPEPNGLFYEVADVVDYAICMCNQYRDELIQQGTKATTVFPGVDNAFFPKLVVGVVGRLRHGHRKGKDFLQSVKEIDFIELRVTDGGLDEKDLPSFYRSLDCVLIASRYEGGPMCLLEGLASGIPVVCPPDVGFADSFLENIIPYKNNDIESLFEALSGLFEDKKRRSLSVSQYTWDNWAESHQEVFNHLKETVIVDHTIRLESNLLCDQNELGGEISRKSFSFLDVKKSVPLQKVKCYTDGLPSKYARLLSLARRRVGRIGRKGCRINDYAEDCGLSEINLHLGCGGKRIEGWINIDDYDYENEDSSRSGAKYDIKMDIRKIDADPNSVDKIMLVHVLEHFVRWEALELFNEFYRVLKPGGSLVMEHPDLDGVIDMHLKNDLNNSIDTPLGVLNMGTTQFYGNQWDKLHYETHRYVWTKVEIKRELERVGFVIKTLDNNAIYHLAGRDMRVVALK